MFTREEDIDAHALRAGEGVDDHCVADHLNRDRKTIRAYLKGERTPGVRAKPVDAQPVLTTDFTEYLTARLIDDQLPTSQAVSYLGCIRCITRLMQHKSARLLDRPRQR